MWKVTLKSSPMHATEKPTAKKPLLEISTTKISTIHALNPKTAKSLVTPYYQPGNLTTLRIMNQQRRTCKR